MGELWALELGLWAVRHKFAWEDVGRVEEALGCLDDGRAGRMRHSVSDQLRGQDFDSVR